MCDAAEAAGMAALLAQAAAVGMSSNLGGYVETLAGAVGSVDRFKPVQENAAAICYYNDVVARDQTARIERTFINGRYQRNAMAAGQVDGIMYCTYKQAALVAKGQKLDP